MLEVFDPLNEVHLKKYQLFRLCEQEAVDYSNDALKIIASRRPLEPTQCVCGLYLNKTSFVPAKKYSLLLDKSIKKKDILPFLLDSLAKETFERIIFLDYFVSPNIIYFENNFKYDIEISKIITIQKKLLGTVCYGISFYNGAIISH